ncbi:MAG TPA: acetylornithine/succinylornithine family transaminase [Bacillota bacterium]|jgi:predicted acetylornithine/succinylornithine family transaminase
MTFEAVRQADHEHVMGTYARAPLALVRGRGTRVWDSEGRSYLDFIGGIAVNVLGHCHPAVSAAIARQARTLIHASNLFYTLPYVEVAELLAGTGVPGKVFFCNSGTEANEGAIKLARKYAQVTGRSGRRIIGLSGGFHGRTLAALAATGKPGLWQGFEPMPAGFAHVVPNDVAALGKAFEPRESGDTPCAVILEIIQGEAGIRPLSPAFLAAARDLCDRHGALLIIDEIQTGMGRTGTFWAFQGTAVRPDIMTAAKGLGGGLPIGFFSATEAVAAALKPGDHGSTFGANPVACAAAVATVKTILGSGFLERVGSAGAALGGLLAGLAGEFPDAVKETRGKGLMAALEMTSVDLAKAVLDGCRDDGLLVNRTADTVIRLLPPLTVSDREIRRAADVLRGVIGRLAGR